MASFESNLHVISPLLDGDEATAEERLERVDAADFADFVERHKLQFLAGRLAPFDDYRAEQRERQGALVDELWALADTLESAGIDFTLLKGLYFADRYCGGIGNRFSWDLDVLVRREDAARVDRLLRRSGYFRRSAVVLSRALTARFTHAFDYGNERPRFSVDLHWLLSRHPSFRVDYDALWDSREPYDLLGRRFQVLSHEYEVVSNALSTFRDIQRGAIRLRAFVDLYRVLEAADAEIDWAGFLERRRDERIAGVTANVLALLLDLFSCADRFPGAAATVARASDLLVAPPDGAARGLFEPGPGALSNRAWTASIYECSRAQVAAWWLVSLPFRMAVYRSGRRYANFKRRIHTTKRRLRGGEAGRARPAGAPLP
jgi:hypothetical protein